MIQTPSPKPSPKPGSESHSESAGQATTATTATAATAAPAPPPFTPPDGQRLYEILWLVDANLGRENLGKVLNGLKELIEKSEAAWVNGGKWDERRLAYPIKKRKRGLYVLSHITAPPQNITRLERNIRLSELVLRHLLTLDEDGVTLTPQASGLEEGLGFRGGGRGGERHFFKKEGRERRGFGGRKPAPAGTAPPSKEPSAKAPGKEA